MFHRAAFLAVLAHQPVELVVGRRQLSMVELDLFERYVAEWVEKMPVMRLG